MGEDDEGGAATTSEDEALLEVLGLTSLGCLAGDGDDDDDDDDCRSRNNTANGAAASHRSSTAAAADAAADHTSCRVPLSPRGLPDPAPAAISAVLAELDLPALYRRDRVVVFPGELSVPAHTMRRMADELIWGSSGSSGSGSGSSVPGWGASGTCQGGLECDRTYETVRVVKRRRRRARKEEDRNAHGRHDQNQEEGKPPQHERQDDDDDDDDDDGHGSEQQGYDVEERRVLTRLENFVPGHDGWAELCGGYLTRLLSALCGRPMTLYKEKLNIKPPGGSGFAPHLDGPSLRVALGDDGPREFVTVMVAIDDMTVRNGCLRVVRGPHSEDNHVEVVLPKADGNPDGDGRAGAIPEEVASGLEFEDVVVKGGTIAAFGGWVPHRSAVNASPFARRAVFLTYNPASEGSCRQRYYDKMKEMREGWRRQVGLAGRQQQQQQQLTEDERLEMEALASIPKI